MSLQNLEFGASKDEQICDRLVIGIADGEVYQKLQLEPELTLEKAIQMLASLSRWERQRDSEVNEIKDNL